MTAHPIFHRPRFLPAAAVMAATLLLAGCGSGGTRLQAPTAGIQQLTIQSNGSWSAVVRFQNYSYNTAMHVYAIDASLSLDGKPAGRIAFSPGLEIPAMDADIGSATFKPAVAGAAALAAARPHAVQYELKGTLSVGADYEGKPQSFKLDSRGYISPVPGVSNIWR